MFYAFGGNQFLNVNYLNISHYVLVIFQTFILHKVSHNDGYQIAKNDFVYQVKAWLNGIIKKHHTIKFFNHFYFKIDLCFGG